jgi:hypothetical protein
MSRPDLAAAMTALPEQGVVLLQGVFSKDLLLHLRESAEACFSRIAAGHTQELAAGYRFTPFSYSVLLAALLEFGVASREELVAHLAVIGLNDLLADVMAGPVDCNLDESWVRKRFAPSNAPRHYHPNTWHQDGGLGVSFGLDRESVLPMTRMLTCWVPLQACGKDSPGLEFVRHPMERLLHYTELQDLDLRQRFAPDRFWAPELEFGDALLFLAGSLHRTHVRPEMVRDRLSLEYRFFPPL